MKWLRRSAMIAGIGAALGLVLLALVWVSAPRWVPAMGPGWLQRAGLEVAAIDAGRDGNWVLLGLGWHGDSLQIAIDRMELPGMTRYLATRWREQPLPLVRIGAVRVNFQPGAAPDPSGADAAEPVAVMTPADALALRDRWQARQQWIPPVRIDNFTLTLQGADSRFLPLTAVAEAIELNGLQLTLRLLELSGRLGFHGRADVEVDFASASPQARLALTGWLRQVELPLEEDIRLEAVAAVDLNGLRLDRAAISGTGIAAGLSQPLAFDFSSRAFAAPAELSLEIDLGRQVLYPLPSGEISAAVAVTEAGRMEIRSAQISLPEGAGAAQVSGWIDFASEQLDLAYEAGIDGEHFGALVGLPVLPASLEIAGDITGVLRSPRVSGGLRLADLQLEGLVPLAVAADWLIHGSERMELHLRADAPSASLSLAAELTLDAEEFGIQINDLVWDSREATALRLQEPVRVHLPRHTPPGTARLWSTQPLRLGDGRTLLSVGIDPSGSISSSGRQFRIRRLREFVDADLPDVDLEAWSVGVGAWQPNLQATINLSGRYFMENQPEVYLEVSGELTGSRLQAQQLEVAVGGLAVLSGSASLPLRIALGDTAGGRLQWDRDAGVQLSLTAVDNPALRDILREQFDIALGRIELDARLSGSLNRPQATLSLQTAELEYRRQSPLDRPWPPVRDVDLRVAVDPQAVEVSTLRARLATDSRVELSGRIGFQDILEWVDGRRTPLQWLRESFEGELRLSGWRGEDWSAYLPGLLRPSGQLSGQLAIRPGLFLDGYLDLSGLSLRPTLHFPSVHELGGRLQLTGNRLSIDQGGASLAGQALAVSGYLDWSEPAAPLGQFRIAGANLPLVRTPTLMLRSDLDLTLQLRPAAPPLLSGRLHLRNSTLLYDFDFLGARTASADTVRPPFFAVAEAPFADWELDVALHGDEFLRVRSAYFAALFSAGFRLSGSLGDPLLLGSARAASGELRFPGARMRLQQAELFITRDQPNEMQVLVSGISERASFVVTMDVSNTVSDPRVVFQSTPQLPNAAIIRLLTTGSLSSNNLSGLGLYFGQGLLGPGSGSDHFLNRLTIEMGRDISRSGRNTIDVELELNRNWLFRGEYDRFDSYNIDLVRRVFSR